MIIEELEQNFKMLEDGEDKFSYLIELGKLLPSFPNELKTEENKIYGCSSNVWFNYVNKNGKYEFLFESDALIVKGLLFVLYIIFNSKQLSEIKQIDVMNIFENIGLKSILSNQRQVGLMSVIEKIKSIN